MVTPSTDDESDGINISTVVIFTGQEYQIILPTLMSFNQKYKMGDRIGIGAYAHVYKAKNRETGEQVAVKLICKQYSTAMGADEQQI